MHVYLRGLTMGLAYVAPIGAQNLFVIQSAMGPSRRRAFLTALIVTFFDVTLALACFFGIGALMERFSLLASLILQAPLMEHFGKAEIDFAAGQGIVGSPVMVEFRQRQGLGHQIQLEFAQLRQKILR